MAAPGAAAAHRVMLGGADDDAAAGAERVDRQGVRLGAAGGEHQIGRPAAEPVGDATRGHPPAIRRAARPAPCTEDGLPVTASAASSAARASGRSFSVALASR